MLLLLLIHILWFGRVSLLALAICQCFGRRDLKRCCSTLLSVYLAVELSSCLSPICLCLDASRSYRKKLRSFGRQGGKEEKLLGKEKQARPLNPPLLRCVVVLLCWLLLLLPLSDRSFSVLLQDYNSCCNNFNLFKNHLQPSFQASVAAQLCVRVSKWESQRRRRETCQLASCMVQKCWHTRI